MQAAEGSLKKNDLRFRVAGDEGMDEEYENLSELDEKEMERINKRKDLEEASNITEVAKALEAEEEKEEETNYYKENIFNKEDYYLFRAVMYFYSGDYDKSLTDLEQSSSIMHNNKVLYPRNQFPDEVSDDNAS